MGETTFRSEGPTFPDVTSAGLPLRGLPSLGALGVFIWSPCSQPRQQGKRQETSPSALGWLVPDALGLNTRGQWRQNFD